MGLHSDAMQTAGADPGIFVRGGPPFRKFRQKRRRAENGRKKTEGCGGSSPSADVIDFPDNYLHTSFFFARAWSFCTIASLSLHKHKDYMVVLYCKCVRGILPQEKKVLNGVKSCNCR